jgi:hypothetical protein
MVFDHCSQGLGPDQCCVTVQDQDRLGPAGKRFAGLLYSIACAPLLLLVCVGYLFPQSSANSIRTMSHYDNDADRFQGEDGIQHEICHGASGDRVQDFGYTGLHARALPSGKNNNC